MDAAFTGEGLPVCAASTLSWGRTMTHKDMAMSAWWYLAIARNRSMNGGAGVSYAVQCARKMMHQSLRMRGQGQLELAL